MIPDYRLLCMYFASYILERNCCWRWSSDACPLGIFCDIGSQFDKPSYRYLHQSLKRHLILCSYILIYVDLNILLALYWKNICIHYVLTICIDIIQSAVSRDPYRLYHTHIHRQIPLGNFNFQVKPTLWRIQEKPLTRDIYLGCRNIIAIDILPCLNCLKYSCHKIFWKKTLFVRIKVLVMRKIASGVKLPWNCWTPHEDVCISS